MRTEEQEIGKVKIKVLNVIARLEFNRDLNLLKIALENKERVRYNETTRFCRMQPQGGHGTITITKHGLFILGAKSQTEAKKELYAALKLLKLFYIENGKK